MSGPGKTKYSFGACSDDVREEVKRLAQFGVEVVFGPISGSWGDGGDTVPLLAFEKVANAETWRVEVSPAASPDEIFTGLRRIWNAITHPDSHPWWDDRRYGSALCLATTHLNDKKHFVDALTAQITELVRTEVRKSTPSMLFSYPWDTHEPEEWEPGGNYDRSKWRPHWGNMRRFIAENADLVSAEVRAEMARQDKTVPQLADVLNLTAATVRKSYKGTRPFHTDELQRVADWLDVPMDDLMRRPYQEVAAVEDASDGEWVGVL